mgnify:CR=1 FL=1
MNVNDFSSKLIGGGVRPHLFEVNGSIGGQATTDNLLPFLVKAAQLPASTVGMIEVPYRGRKIKVPGERTFAERTITIVADGNFELRDAFESWMNNINSHAGNTTVGTHRPGAGNPIYSDWEINQLDRNGDVIKAYKMMHCFPTEVSAMDVGFETTDSIHEFTVTLQYSYWTALGKKSSFGTDVTDGDRPSGSKFTSN